ncbi:ankyrin-1-like [Anneissia japonica]|uniref:ankyrin-1-like n=1 Tax=Anneissia japonica TaxID=1529436 RepID=UPI00142558CA|nr:ankyrin-1-like [Anneissia japonica]
MGTTLTKSCRTGGGMEQSQIMLLVAALKDQDNKTVIRHFRDTTSRERNTLLQFCIRSKLYEEVNFLLKSIKGNLEKKYLEYLLMVAAEKGLLTLIATILEHDVDVNAISAKGHSPLSYAVKYKHSEVIVDLVAAGANTNFIDDNKNSVLIQAIGNGNNFKTISVLLDNGADLSIKNLRKRTALFYAVDENMVDVANLLLDKGADIHSIDDEGTTVLMVSSYRGYEEMTKMLLRLDSNIGIKDNYGYTALMCAVQNKHYVLTKMIVDKYRAMRSRNADIMESAKLAIEDDLSEILKILLHEQNLLTNSQLITLLTLALENSCEKDIIVAVLSQYKDLLFYAASNPKHESVLKMLITNKVPMNYLDCQGNSVLMYAVARGSENMVIELLHANVTDVNIKNQCQLDALFFAVFVDDVNKAEALLKSKADVNAIEENECTPLMYAALRGSTDMCRLLLRYGANVNLTEKENFSVLMVAAQNNHVEVAKELLVYGVDIAQKNDYGHDALFKAVQNNNVDIVRLLLKHGAPVNSVDISGNTPLIESCRVSDSIDIVNVILDEGADVNKQGEDGFSALMCACKSGSTSIADLLILHNASLELTNDLGRDAFHIAIYNAHVNLAAFLLQQSKASLNKTDKMSNTPLITACSKENIECVKMLLKEGASYLYRNQRGYTALMSAIQLGNEDLVKMLIENMEYPYQTGMTTDMKQYELHTNNPFTDGINLTSFTAYKEQHHLIHIVSHSNKKNNFLHHSENGVDVYACAGLSGDSEVLKEVLFNDPNVLASDDEIDQFVQVFEDSTNGNFQTLYDMACNRGVIRRLVRAAICAATRRNSAKILNELLQWHNNKENVNLLKLVILIACLYGSNNVIELLITFNVDANTTFTPFGETPLVITLMSKHGKASQILPLLAPVTDLTKRFSLQLSAQYRVEVTILMYASLMGNYTAVKDLIKHGASVDQTTEYGLGAIHFCTFGRRGMQCHVGLTHEMNSVMMSRKSSSSSQEDLMDCYCDILKLLLANCDHATNKCTDDGKCLLSWAVGFQLEDFVKLLKDHYSTRVNHTKPHPGHARERLQKVVPKVCKYLKALVEEITFHNTTDAYQLQKSFAERMSETCTTFTDAFRNINNMDEPEGLFESLLDDYEDPTASEFSTTELDSSINKRKYIEIKKKK